VTLTGIRTAAEIEDNVAALDVHLSDAVLQAMDTIMAGAAGQTDKVPA
jgi:aryl-alcohol dehydrogenase-like predicted oxidoreductase